LLVLLNGFQAKLNLWRLKSGGLNKDQIGLAKELSSKPEERLLEVVIAARRDIVVLEILLAVECDLLSLHLSVLDVDLVAAENDWDMLANANKITMPVGHVLVSKSRSDIKHDDGSLALDVVAIAKTTKLLLASGIPNVKNDGTTVSMEAERMNLYTKGSDVFLLKLAGQMALNEGGLSGTTITDKNKLESRDLAGRNLVLDRRSLRRSESKLLLKKNKQTNKCEKNQRDEEVHKNATNHRQLVLNSVLTKGYHSEIIT